MLYVTQLEVYRSTRVRVSRLLPSLESYSCHDIRTSSYKCLFNRGGTGLRFSSSGGLGLCLFELGSGSGLGSILKFKLGRARALHFRARVGLGPRTKYVKKLWISSFKT